MRSTAITRKRVTLQGQTVEQLERRIETFGRALHMRYGIVLRVKRTAARRLLATVHYQLPIMSLRAEP